MARGPEQFAQRLEREPLQPVYLIAGPEVLRVHEAVDALRARARRDGFIEREVFEVDAGFDWTALQAALCAPSLFAKRRIFELRLPTTRPGRDGAAFIEHYCADPAPDTLLLIVGGEWSGKHAAGWTRAVQRTGTLVEAWPLKPDELPHWLRTRLARAGLDADDDAVDLLLDRVEGNLLAAAQEIDKLALLHPGARLDVDTMAAAVADSARFNVFGLVDAVLAGQTLRAVRVLAALRAEGEQVPGLMGWVVVELQRLATLASAQSRDADMSAAFAAANVRGGRQPVYRRVLRRHPTASWEGFLVEAGRVDRIAKGREAGNAWLALERLLVAVAEPGATCLVD